MSLPGSTRVLTSPSKFIVFRGRRIRLYPDVDSPGIYRSWEGTVFALREDNTSVDLIDRCGVGIFSLDPKHPLTDACKPHEFMYSSPAFQLFNTREEADKRLAELVDILQKKKGSFVGKVFRTLAQWFGASLWENKKTR